MPEFLLILYYLGTYVERRLYGVCQSDRYIKAYVGGAWATGAPRS